VLELNWCCAICISRGLKWQKKCYLTLSSLLFSTNSVVVMTEYLNLNHFQYHWIGKRKKTLTSDAPRTRFLYIKKKRWRQDFLVGKLSRRQNLFLYIKKWDWILLGTLSCWRFTYYINRILLDRWDSDIYCSWSPYTIKDSSSLRMRDDVKPAQLVRARDCQSPGRHFDAGKKTQNPENSNLQWFELHRLSKKGTKLVFQIIRVSINQGSSHYIIMEISAFTKSYA